MPPPGSRAHTIPARPSSREPRLSRRPLRHGESERQHDRNETCVSRPRDAKRAHPSLAADHLRAHLQIPPIRVTQQIPRNRAARKRPPGPHDAAGPTDMELP